LRVNASNKYHIETTVNIRTSEFYFPWSYYDEYTNLLVDLVSQDPPSSHPRRPFLEVPALNTNSDISFVEYASLFLFCH